MSKPFHICENVYIIGSAEISHPYDCCVYLIDAGELILIDSGAGRSFDRLVDNIITLGLAPEKISTVVVTHCHIDHIGSLTKFKQKYGACCTNPPAKAKVAWLPALGNPFMQQALWRQNNSPQIRC